MLTYCLEGMRDAEAKQPMFSTLVNQQVQDIQFLFIPANSSTLPLMEEDTVDIIGHIYYKRNSLIREYTQNIGDLLILPGGII